ncbi:MAG: hypothetical protein L6Q92_16500 [Phycisphaerae bacterium]|nr:hypothetical protein [Phycisphaerae bacterium]
MTRPRHILFAGCCALAVTGCAATTARQSMSGLSACDAQAGPGPPATARAAQPAPTPNGNESHTTAQGSQQSGQGNVTGQIDASGWKAIEYSSAVPVGQVILMGLMLILSHRREMARIKQNGRHAVPTNGEIAT